MDWATSRSRAGALLPKAAFGLYALPRRIDLAGAMFGATPQIFRHVAEAIGMVFADQLAIRTLDGALVGVARHAQHGVRIGAIAARRGAITLLLGPGTGVRPVARARARVPR